MRDLFPGYYPLTQAEFETIWKTGLIVPDANILLHLLRYGEGTRKQVLDALKLLKPRLVIPHRVAFEFSRNWRDVDASNRAAYEKIQRELKTRGEALASVFNGYR